METGSAKRRERLLEISSKDSLELVLVIWKDAHAEEGSWLDLEDVDDEPYIVKSAGFLLRGAKTGHVSIAQSVGADDGVVDHILHVPQEMVIAVGLVEIPDDVLIKKKDKRRRKKDK